MRQEYEMVFKGQRKNLSSSLHGDTLAIIENTGWDEDQIGNATATLIDEMLIRIEKRNKFGLPKLKRK